MKSVQKNNAGIKVRCPRPECRYTWIFNGIKKVNITCAGCQRKINFEESIVRE